MLGMETLGSSLPTVVNRSWCINTRAPLLLRQDDSDVYVLHWLPEFSEQIEASVTPRGSWFDTTCFPGYLPFPVSLHHVPASSSRDHLPNKLLHLESLS